MTERQPEASSGPPQSGKSRASCKVRRKGFNRFLDQDHSGVVHDLAAHDATAPTSRVWAVLGVQLLLFVGTFALLWPTTASLVTAWEDGLLATYTHGYLIVAVSAWLLVRQRAQLAFIPVKPFLLSCVPLAIASLAWLMALRSGIQLAHEVLLPVMAWLAVCAALGLRIGVECAFAFGFLYAAVPVWSSISTPLQDITVAMTEFLLRASSVPAYVQGNVVYLAAGTFEIQGGCSGLHYVIVAIAIGALYGEIRQDRLAIRLGLLGLAVALALITNWLRVYIIITLGYLTDMQHYLVRVEHYRFGWVLFAAMMIAYFLIARRWPWRDVVPPQPADDAKGSGLQDRWPVAFAITLAALALGPAWNVLVPISAAALPEIDALLPRAAGAWRGPQVSADSWQPHFVGADVERRAQYVNGQVRIEAFVAAYATQAQKKELVGYGNSFVNDGTDRIVATRQIEPLGPVVELQLADASGQRSLIWYFYRIDTLQTGSDLLAQASYGASSLVKSPVASVIALKVPCEADCEPARDALRELLRLLQT